MKVVFMGTPAFAVLSLQALIAHHNVLAVCTQPDRPAGRGYKLQASEVKKTALTHGIPVLQPETLRLGAQGVAETRAQLESLGADIFVVAAYGLLLPKGVLSMPPLSCINVHASLLPKYRGASPIHSALLNGDTETGITIMRMDVGLDTGDIILQKSLEILPEEHFPQLHNKMAELGAEALLEALAQIENGTAVTFPQDNALASYSPMIKKTDGKINWADTSEKIINQIRALDPWPGCFTLFGEQILKIFGAEDILKPWGRNFLEKVSPPNPLFKNFNIEPGTVLAASPSEGLIVKTGDGAVLITELQTVGKKRLPSTDFLRGQKIDVDTVLNTYAN